MKLQDELDALLVSAGEAMEGTGVAPAITSLRARLHGPLRVAIAGRVKAGKSTLLNALLGERLAPTDAGECTRFVTWYTYGDGYDVWFEVPDQARRPLRFTNEGGRLEFEVPAEATTTHGRIHVEWPSARLKGLTIIDTPGLGSLGDGVSERTVVALTDRRLPDADAVIYLMRHLHASDVSFLESFLDDQLAEATPVNSVAVLSRADELAGGRLDALKSAQHIAQRYRADPRVQVLASAVVPVAGLRAETAATLQEREADSLRMVAHEPGDVRDELLLSVGQFRDLERGALTGELREELLARFGLFGIRLAVATFLDGNWTTAAQLARLLTRESGVGELDQLLRVRLAGRAQQLVARTVLDGLRNELERVHDNPASSELLGRIEQVEAAAHEIAELRMLDLIWSGTVPFSESEREEAERLTGPGTVADRLGCPQLATPAELRSSLVEEIGRWRERAADPLVDRQTALCCETMAHCYEGLYATVRSD